MADKGKKNKPSPPDIDGRDKKGRFKPGNKCAEGFEPANKRTPQSIQLAILDVCTPERIKAILNVLIRKALAGDVKAAQEVLDRRLGKPKQGIELSGMLATSEWTKLSPAERMQILKQSFGGQND